MEHAIVNHILKGNMLEVVSGGAGCARQSSASTILNNMITGILIFLKSALKILLYP
jgi:hypothetical protein